MDIKSIRAGRTCDELIAEKIFERDRATARIDPITRNGEPQYHWGYPLGHDFAPFYSTEIAAAWLVHLKMLGRIFSVRQRYLAALSQQAADIAGFPVAWPDVLLVLRHTMPYEICRAALTCVEAQ